MNAELLESLRYINYGVSKSELLNDAIRTTPFPRDQVKLITLCAYGAGKSHRAATLATEKHVTPALYVKGGCSGILDNIDNSYFSKLISRINQFQHVAVILRPDEAGLYDQVTRELRHTYYPDEEAFLADLPK